MSSNIFQTVQTYNKSELGLLLNLYGVLTNLNSKYIDFDRIPGQLGQTVGYSLPSRIQTIPTLNVLGNFLPVAQRVRTITVAKERSVPWSVTSEELIFNARDYMNEFGRAGITALGGYIEQDVAKDINIYPYRFYGTPSAPITTYNDLSKALAMFADMGAANYDLKCLLPNMSVPNIVTSGLTNFTPNANNEERESYMIGTFDNCRFIKSNLLPTHIAGSVGIAGSPLTLISIDSTGTILTFSGATANDPNAVLAGDKFQFNDNVPSYTNVRFLNYTTYTPCANPVQFTAVSDAAANVNGHVIVTSNIPLLPLIGSPPSANANISTPLVAGMEATVLGSFRSGILWSGNAWFLAMPTLPSQAPFASSSERDPNSGISVRSYYGPQIFTGKTGYSIDAIWGSDMVPDYAMQLIFPI